MSNIDFDHLSTHGRLSQADAQALHQHLMSQYGITESDRIITIWNEASPEAPWDSIAAQNGTSEYIEELTTLVIECMKEKIAKAQSNTP